MKTTKATKTISQLIKLVCVCKGDNVYLTLGALNAKCWLQEKTLSNDEVWWYCTTLFSTDLVVFAPQCLSQISGFIVCTSAACHECLTIIIMHCVSEIKCQYTHTDSHVNNTSHMTNWCKKKMENLFSYYESLFTILKWKCTLEWCIMKPLWCWMMYRWCWSLSHPPVVTTQPKQMRRD